MRAFTLFTSALLLLSSGRTLACTPGNSTNNTEVFAFGPDEYPPLETIGWNINHFSLFVNDLAASLEFYVNVLGMRRIFTYTPTPDFKLIYLGYPSGGRNGTGYQTPPEMLRDKNNMQGLIELLWIRPAATDPPRATAPASSDTTNTFSHYGLVVPDMAVARQRLINSGVKVYKDVGADFDPATGDPGYPNAYGGGLLPAGSKKDAILQGIFAGFRGIGGLAYMIVEDPDGNIIEVTPFIDPLKL